MSDSDEDDDREEWALYPPIFRMPAIKLSTLPNPWSSDEKLRWWRLWGSIAMSGGLFGFAWAVWFCVGTGVLAGLDYHPSGFRWSMKGIAESLVLLPIFFTVVGVLHAGAAASVVVPVASMVRQRQLTALEWPHMGLIVGGVCGWISSGLYSWGAFVSCFDSHYDLALIFAPNCGFAAIVGQVAGARAGYEFAREEGDTQSPTANDNGTGKRRFQFSLAKVLIAATIVAVVSAILARADQGTAAAVLALLVFPLQHWLVGPIALCLASRIDRMKRSKGLGAEGSRST